MNIKRILEEYIKNRQLSGTIMVSKNDDIIANQSFGVADRSANIKCCTNTQYLIGSVTKQFTAVALLSALYNEAIASSMAKDNIPDIRKKISKHLNNPISNYLAATHKIWASDMPKWANSITLHQLLIHSSGLVDYTSLSEFKDAYVNPPENPDLVSVFKNKALEFPMGSKYSYSNSGYILLGEIIQQLTGQALDVYFERSFFKPLNMHKTLVATKGTVNDLKRMTQFEELARGYEIDVTSDKPEIKEVEKYCPMQITGAAGSMVSIAPDLLRWSSELYSENILPSSLLNLMLSPHIKVNDTAGKFYGYGVGVSINPTLGTIYEHEGSIDGFTSQLMYIPSLKLSIVCLSNMARSFEKLEPEINKIKAQLPVTLSPSEAFKIVNVTLRKKFPAMSANEDHFLASEFATNLVKILSSENKI